MRKLATSVETFRFKSLHTRISYKLIKFGASRCGPAVISIGGLWPREAGSFRNELGHINDYPYLPLEREVGARNVCNKSRRAWQGCCIAIFGCEIIVEIRSRLGLARNVGGVLPATAK